MEGRDNYVRVISHLDKPFVGRFNGRDWKFIPEQPVDLPEEAAAHIFDFGRADKTRALLRLGWAKSGDELNPENENLMKISFEEPPEMIEAPKKPKAHKKTGTAGPPVNAGGTEGGVEDEGIEQTPKTLTKAPPTGPRIGEQEVGGVDASFD